MQTDISDSMAEGVSNAACIIPFMTDKYESSANCKLVRCHFEIALCTIDLSLIEQQHTTIGVDANGIIVRSCQAE